MDAGFGMKTYIIVKGYVDAKDERGNALYGTILGLVSRRDIKYLSVMFSRDKIPKSMEWNDLLAAHKDKGDSEERDPAIVRREDGLLQYLDHAGVLNVIAKNHNTKQAEQSISRYCMESLQLKAISLVEYLDASDDDISVFEAEKAAEAGPWDDSGGEGAPSDQDGDGSADEAESENAPKGRDEIAVRCDPILDPVNGVAMNELNVGERILAKLPGDSVFFKLLSRNIRGFDGVVMAEITGILLNELGTATISLSLSEGISGVMKLSGKIRVKVAPAHGDGHASRPRMDIPPSFVFGLASVVIVLSAIAILYYILM
ncbi:MAG: hypothetical protein LBQ36_06705 [Synergistaceae bacterium]|jgi:hypothetical protein|nr:hypothetical protein [Synergistaceae bacterium]